MGKPRFNSSDYYHYAKRAEIYGLEEVKEQLQRSGWKLSQNNEIDEGVNQQALQRIAQVPKLETTCFSQDCPKCKKLVNTFGETPSSQPWRLNLELYRWQKEAKAIWKKEGGQGIVRVVTGAGKTILALGLMDYLYQKYPERNLKTIIVVPTTALLDQWYGNIASYLDIPEKEIGTYYGEAKDALSKKQVMLYVINSARDHLPAHLENINQDVFLIVDECHRAGSAMNRKIFNATYDYKLGLSATPERRGDFGFEEVLLKHLGKVIFSYSYSNAREDGIIPPYRLKRIAVPLTTRERENYEYYSKKINKIATMLFQRYPSLENVADDYFFKQLGKIYKRTQDDLIEKYTALVNKRKGIIHTSETKIMTLKYLIQNEIDTRARILIFHERTAYADRINHFLHQEGIKSAVYHTKIDAGERRNNLQNFRDGEINILITCRALDEGLDVPDTSVGIIVAATSSVRQRVQRIGRILRKAPGKDFSEIYTIYIDGIEDNIFSKRDLRILEESAQKIEKIKMGFRN